MRHWIWSLCVLQTMATAEATAGDYPLVDAAECRPRGGLPNVLAKLKKGGDVRIAYLGGSITNAEGWRPMTRDWFDEKYFDAKVDQINAAVSGTGSDLGACRLAHDVLRHKPDLLFVEFAVNDGWAPAERIQKGMEGIVRQAWTADPTLDICFVYTLAQGGLKDLHNGKLPRTASIMESVADHYAIPSIHMAVEVAQLEKEGELVFAGRIPRTAKEIAEMGDKTLFSEDGVHPHIDTGHPLYAQAVAHAMPAIDAAGEPGPHTMPEPLVADNWERAKMVPVDKGMLSGEWRQLSPAKDDVVRDFQDRLPGPMWTAGKPGEKLTVRFKGTDLMIYDLVGPDCGQLTVTVDDQPSEVQMRFDSWADGYRLANLVVADSLPDAEHTVTIEIHPDQPDKREILSQRNIKMDDPKRFDGTAWYVGALLVVGDVIEPPEPDKPAASD